MRIIQHRLVQILAALCLVLTVEAQQVDDATLIERLRANRSLFPEWDHGPSLRKRVQVQGSDITYQPIVSETSLTCDECAEPNNYDHPEVKRVAKDADLVIVGRVARNISALTEKEAFIFTDSEVVIDQLWKRHLPAKIQYSVGSEITVARPGGTMRIEGHNIKALPSNLVPLRVDGRYLLFLKFLSSSNSFVPIGFEGFSLEDNVITSLQTSRRPAMRNLLNNPWLFLETMRVSVDKSSSETLSDQR